LKNRLKMLSKTKLSC